MFSSCYVVPATPAATGRAFKRLSGELLKASTKVQALNYDEQAPLGALRRRGGLRPGPGAARRAAREAVSVAKDVRDAVALHRVKVRATTGGTDTLWYELSAHSCWDV